jgi:hypothetical protein
MFKILILLIALAVSSHAGPVQDAYIFIHSHSRDDCVHAIKYGDVYQNKLRPDQLEDMHHTEHYRTIFYKTIWNWLVKTGPPMLPGQDHPD